MFAYGPWFAVTSSLTLSFSITAPSLRISQTCIEPNLGKILRLGTFSYMLSLWKNWNAMCSGMTLEMLLYCWCKRWHMTIFLCKWINMCAWVTRFTLNNRQVTQLFSRLSSHPSDLTHTRTQSSASCMCACVCVCTTCSSTTTQAFSMNSIFCARARYAHARYVSDRVQHQPPTPTLATPPASCC